MKAVLPDSTPTRGDIDPQLAGRLGQALRHAALQRTVEGLSRVTCDHARDLFDADAADCVFFDADAEILWRVDSSVDLPVSGLIGEVVSTGRPRIANHAATQSGFRAAVDDPDSIGAQSMALAPVLDGQKGVQAVLVVVRKEGTFDAEAAELLRVYADRISVVFESVHLESVLAESMRDAVATQADALFDPVALAAHREGKLAEVVEFPPLLPPIAYVFAALALLAMLALSTVARVNRYASGPSLVLSPTSMNVASPSDAILESVYVEAGDTVVGGQPLVHLNAEKERHDLSVAETEYEQRLMRRLGNPADRDLEAAVAEARVILDRARSRMEERMLVAPRDGIIEDLRLSVGQPVSAGQTVVSLGPSDAELTLRAAIPAHHLPALEVGQSLRFEPLGYTFSFEHVEVTAIGSRVLGPSELRAVFGRESGDTLTVDGPVVVIEARLAGTSFQHDGVDYRFHPGMVGQADIQVSDDPALVVLMPFLKRVW